MPRYLGASVRLVTAKLDQTIHKESEINNTPGLSANLMAIDEGFGHSGEFIQEIAIPGDDGLALRYLGSSDKKHAFKLMQAGEKLWDPNSFQPLELPPHHAVPQAIEARETDDSTSPESASYGRMVALRESLGRLPMDRMKMHGPKSKKLPSVQRLVKAADRCLDPPGPTKTADPKAFAVSIELSRDSFRNHVPEVPDSMPLDVKVDVFLNGELCRSCFVALRQKRDSPIVGWKERCSGRRVGRLLEVPWILVSQGSTNAKANHVARDGQRWTTINEKLRILALRTKQRHPTGQQILADYLNNVADIEMPIGFSRQAQRKFAIIDVVCTSGVGAKNKSGDFMNDPEPMDTTEMHAPRMKWTLAGREGADDTAEASPSGFKGTSDDTPKTPSRRTDAKQPTTPKARILKEKQRAALTPDRKKLETSSLDRDCIVTYQPQKLRQICSERPGSFEEYHTLFGVRYLMY